MATSTTSLCPTPFASVAIVHPAMLSPEDGDTIAVPLGFYPSMDEPKDVVEKIHKAVEEGEFAVKCVFKLYDTM